MDGETKEVEAASGITEICYGKYLGRVPPSPQAHPLSMAASLISRAVYPAAALFRQVQSGDLHISK